MKQFLKENILLIAFLQALVATLGSLYFSEVMHFPPCVLCWYQRICMYPLTLIIPIGYFRNSKDITWFVLPFSLLGLGISAYHNLLYYNILPESITPCQAGISCTTKYIEWFGFITIPLLSFIAFSIITMCMIAYSKFQSGRKIATKNHLV